MKATQITAGNGKLYVLTDDGTLWESKHALSGEIVGWLDLPKVTEHDRTTPPVG